MHGGEKLPARLQPYYLQFATSLRGVAVSKPGHVRSHFRVDGHRHGTPGPLRLRCDSQIKVMSVISRSIMGRRISDLRLCVTYRHSQSRDFATGLAKVGFRSKNLGFS